MAKRFSRARLIAREDPRYQSYLEQHRVAREYQRAMRPPSSRQVFGEQVEQLLRDWLGQTRTLSERRYLEYEEQKGRRAALKYRELDAVEIPEPRTIRVFEIKASSAVRSLRHGLDQLRQDREILALLFPRVAVTLLFVDTGMLPEERQAALELEEHVVVLPDLAQPASYGEKIGLHWISLERIVELAGGEENLSLEWMHEDEGEGGQPVLEKPPQTWSSGREEDLGALGRALLEALGEEG